MNQDSACSKHGKGSYLRVQGAPGKAPEIRYRMLWVKGDLFFLGPTGFPQEHSGRGRTQATEQSRIRDRLEPRTVPTGGFQEKQAFGWECELWDVSGGWAKLMRGY